MADKMAASCGQFALVDTLTQSFIIQLLENFIYGLLLSKAHPSSNVGFVL